MKIADLRNDYKRATLDESTVAADPVRQFEHWFAEVLELGLPEPTAMTLATSGQDGKPSARIVLLKGFDARGFTFFTNYTSRKARELADRAHAALLFFWADLERQVRIEGTTFRLDPAESAAYFASRPRPSQIGAWASPQSQVVAGRQALVERFAEFDAKYAAGSETVPYPPHWGGYRVTPDLFEFWQGRESRMHDRIRYRRLQGAEETWAIDRLAP